MTTFDILPCLKLSQYVRSRGAALGMVRTANPDWTKNADDQPRWFWRAGWMVDFHGFDFGFETLDYTVTQWRGAPHHPDSFSRRRVNTIDERGYELIGAGWTLRFEFQPRHDPQVHALSFLGVWGVPCGVRMWGDRAAFQRQMTLVRLGTPLDTWAIPARDPETYTTYTITRCEVEMRG